MDRFVLTPLAPSASPVEVVERKGAGHPDTICDALAEQLSRDLCAAYRREFGAILHHNVDKALLSAGASRAAFGGGEIDRPIGIYLAGRATTHAGGAAIPVDDIAVASARRWLTDHLHALDVDRHLRVVPLLHPGSQDLRALYGRGDDRAPPANDTSFGVGYAPLSPLERCVLAVDHAIAAEITSGRRPAWGEDVKVMAIRTGEDLRLTISCALIGPALADMAAYLEETSAIRRLALEISSAFGFRSCEAVVNAADDPSSGSVYLTVTGTSAEAGDDGQVGRGNRVNGLITPGRPMSLEAAAGKNPVTHVGKLYNVAAREIARRVTAAHPEVRRAECLLVSRIGSPIDRPAVAEVRVDIEPPAQASSLALSIEGIVADTLAELPRRVDDFVAGAASVY